METIHREEAILALELRENATKDFNEQYHEQPRPKRATNKKKKQKQKQKRTHHTMAPPTGNCISASPHPPTD